MALWLASYFTSRGYAVQFQEMDKGLFQAIAILKGTEGGRSIMFNGHLDSNPLATGWTRDPFDPWIEDDKLYGAGISNVKSGVSSMSHSSEAIRKSGVRPAGDIVVTFVVVGLQGGSETKYLLDHGCKTDFAVVTEPYGAHNIVTKHSVPFTSSASIPHGTTGKAWTPFL